MLPAVGNSIGDASLNAPGSVTTLHRSRAPDGGTQPGRDPVGARVRLCLLDGFELRADGRAVSLPVSAQRVLAFLALQERPMLRTFVAGSLYLDKSEERAAANLRTVLWRLRQPGIPLVTATANHLGLAPTVAVDLHEAFARARRVLGGSSEEATDTLLLRGDLLPDWYDDWVITDRERLRQVRLHALDALCSSLVMLGAYARAIEVGMASIAAEPLRESAHRAVIGVHLAEGNRSEALRQYAVYVSLLRESLALEPSDQLKDLVGVT